MAFGIRECDQKGAKMNWLFLAIGFVIGGLFAGIIISACVVAGKSDEQTDRARKIIEEDRKLPRRKQ